MTAGTSPCEDVSGCLFDIQPYSVHDGPGIRTLAFLKGCPLSCTWCSNPEGQSFVPQIRFFQKRCEAACERCLPVCPKRALTKQNSSITVDFSLCGSCTDFNCVLACPTGALSVCGFEMESAALVERMAQDVPFFGEDGGVTLSGGEPFAQPDFVAAVLEQCKARGMHTAVETCLHVSFEHIKGALAFLDFVMFDIKFIDEERHVAYCGVGNKTILENIAGLKKCAAIPLLPRVPIVPAVNDDEKNMRLIARFLKEQGFHHVNLVPYMRLGVEKYEQLGLRCLSRDIVPHDEGALKTIASWFAEEGITTL